MEPEAGYAFVVGRDCGLGQFEQLSTIDKRFQDVLLNVQVAIDNGGLLLTQFRILDRLADAVVCDVVGSGFGAKIGVVADVLFGEAVLVVASHHGIGQIHILDHGLKLSRGSIW